MVDETIHVNAHDGTVFTVSKNDWETEKVVELGKRLYYKVVPFELSWQACHKKHTTYIRFGLSGKYEIRLHRLLVEAKYGELVDHIDRNGLNNTAGNLRIVTEAGNAQNRSHSVGRKYKGIYWCSSQGKYHAHIKFDGKKRHLGSFATDVEAAQAYDFAAIKHFGDYAALNFPKDRPC